MATLYAQARRLTFWLLGTPDDSPPPVPIPPVISPLLGHVAFFMNIRGRIPPEMTREEIMDKMNTYVTDRQLQAHAMAYLRDYHHMTFDPQLNPRAPYPQYYSTTRRRGPSPEKVPTRVADAKQAGKHMTAPDALSAEQSVAATPRSPRQGKTGTTPRADAARKKKKAAASAEAAAAPKDAATATAAAEKQTAFDVGSAREKQQEQAEEKTEKK